MILTIHKRFGVSWSSSGRAFLALLTLAIVVISAGSSYGQNVKTNMKDTVVINDKKVHIKAARTIIPESVIVQNKVSLAKHAYTLENNKIIIAKSDIPDTLLVSYRMLAIDIAEHEPILNPNGINKKSYLIKINADYNQEENLDRRLIQSNKLQYSGSFSRGINFGNTQDLVLNSDFNLQMTGDLGNNLFIRAAISDDNIPIQPEGNTQVLQEFDKVFIEIQKDRTKFIAGDYELARPQSYFMNYYKKLKGFSASNLYSSENGWDISNKGSFAISRGKFQRIQLETQEGNQGPYRLEGENGDIFVQVLSGTEKVYADGVLLKRGDNYDYIIDYNRAEIRFTPNIVINPNIRIIVEYEFATQTYLRSLYATTSSFEKDDIRFDFNFYNEQDSKTITGNIQLDSTDLSILSMSGDGQSLKSGLFIPEEGDFSGLITYSIINDILVYNPDVTADVVSARFSNVGVGNGSYLIDNEVAANGRVYKYVGENSGSFDPVIQLIAPEKRQLITGSFAYDNEKNTKVYLETGVSLFDDNRFSETGNEDNLGVSVLAKVSNIKTLGKLVQSDSVQSSNWRLLTDASIELKQKNFRALNPYRPPEFSRDWNLTELGEGNDQLLHPTALKLKKNTTSFGYSLDGFHDKNIYSGYRHIGSAYHKDLKWTIDGQMNFLHARSNFSEESSQFLRPKLLVQREIYQGWGIGAYFEKEENIRRDLPSDSLKNTSFNYDLYRAFITSDQNKAFFANFSVTQRNDDRVKDGLFQRTTEAIDYTTGGQWLHGKNSDLKWNFTIRDFQDLDENENDESKKTVIGNLEHNYNILNRGIVLYSYYESESGQEPIVEFQFVQVQRGEGSYVWEDFNQDSITQINEFRLAPQPDLGEYEKISVFNNEFIRSNKSILNQSLKVIPKKFLENKKSFLGKFQTSFRYRIEQRSTNNNQAFINPLVTDSRDTSLVSYNASLDNNLFYNRGNASHDVQLSYRSFSNVITQITGRDLRGNKEFFTRTRVNLIQAVDAVLETSNGRKSFDSEAFPEQAFEVNFWRLIPQINFRPTPKFRIVTKYAFEKNNNTILAKEQSIHHDLSLDITWRQSTKSSLQATFSMVLIDYQGTNNTPVEFELLQGLQNGTNYLWNVNYTRRVGKNFDMIFNYNARKSEDARLVNNLGVQLRAVF